VSRAYLHWYSRYGVSDDHFERAFHSIGSVLESYRGVLNDAVTPRQPVSDIHLEASPFQPPEPNPLFDQPL
jgi:hypothetical protein